MGKRAIDIWDAELADMHARITQYRVPLDEAAKGVAEMHGGITAYRLKTLYVTWSALLPEAERLPPGFRDVTNRAAVGIEWTDRHGHPRQLSWNRGTDALCVAWQLPGGMWRWTTVENVRPHGDMSQVQIMEIMRNFALVEGRSAR